MDEDTPAKSNASANTVEEAAPSMGSSVHAAWARSVTGVPAFQNTEAASSTMALLMAHPTAMEKSVSTNSLLKRLAITSSPHSLMHWL